MDYCYVASTKIFSCQYVWKDGSANVFYCQSFGTYVLVFVSYTCQMIKQAWKEYLNHIAIWHMIKTTWNIIELH